MSRLIEEKIVATVGVGETEGEPEVPYVPPYAPPPAIPVAPSRISKVTRSKYYSEHEKIKKEVDKAGAKGVCVTAEELASKTGIDVEIVHNHLDIMSLDEASKEVHGKSGVVCSVDGMGKLVETLRKLRT